MTEQPTLAEALALLPQREPDEQGRSRVHTFLDSPVALIGADWDREEVAALLEAASARGEVWYTTGRALAMGHGLMAIEHTPDGKRRTVFIETRGGQE